ncbi:guanine nucleotide-binding protein subunit gamma 1-like isoform X1 [Wolffia australiana]
MEADGVQNAVSPSPIGVLGDGAVGDGRDLAPEVKGKHRIVAELKRFEQETKFLEEELEKLEKTDRVSSACQLIIQTVESKPDPLLPVTIGPVNPSWERWFEGPQDSPSCRCRIL